MLKLPKGLKKKKKGKKSKRKGEDELFTEEELEKYKKDHQQQQAVTGEGSKENEEWSKFQNLTKGIDSVLKQTQGDLDRIKSTSFFQRIPAGPKEVDRAGKEREKKRAESPPRAVVEVTEADFPQLAAAAEVDEDRSEYGVTDDESEDDDQDDIFDTSFVEAVERGEVKLAYVPDSPEEAYDDIFDTSHVDALIKGQETKTTKGKKALDIGVAVEVLTGRIDNVTVPTSRRSKRVIPGDLLLEDDEREVKPVIQKVSSPSVEKSILDVDEDLPFTTPIDLSVSLHTALIKQNEKPSEEDLTGFEKANDILNEEDDEFTQLATESLEISGEVTKLKEEEIKVAAVIQDSWSAFEADKNQSVFAESIVEDQLDTDPYYDQDDPFDTSFADAVVPSLDLRKVATQTVILSDDEDFDPRAEEIQSNLNNRRKSSVRIHLTDPSGIRESITSDDIVEKEQPISRDLLGGSTTDLSQLGDSPLNPVDINTTEDEIDPFDTTIVDKIVAPGKIELKLLEKELIDATPITSIYRVDSDPDFDPRAEETEPIKVERRASRPENLVVNKSVGFNVEGSSDFQNSLDTKFKQQKPVTPYYTREISITEEINEEAEAADSFPETLTRTRSDEDLAPKVNYQTKRRYSEFSQPKQAVQGVNLRARELFEIGHSNIQTKVLTPSEPLKITQSNQEKELDPFDTSFAEQIAPSKTELSLLAKEFSCEETKFESEPDLLEPHDDIFQIKALTPEPTASVRLPEEDIDPFDTSFASDLQPGKTELKLLESEFLN